MERLFQNATHIFVNHPKKIKRKQLHLLHSLTGHSVFKGKSISEILTQPSQGPRNSLEADSPLWENWFLEGTVLSLLLFKHH